MDNEMKAEINRIWDESHRLNKRVEIMEEDLKELKRIALSVEKLAIQMENMTKEQAKLSESVEEIKNRPAQAWSTMTRTIFTAIVSTIAGGLAVALIQMINSAM